MQNHFTPKQLTLLSPSFVEKIKNAQRQNAFEAILSEREYQDDLNSTRTDGKDRSVGDYLTMLGYYYNQAVAAWTMNAGDNEALHIVRKIAGIAVHCMEDHGAPLRKI